MNHPAELALHQYMDSAVKGDSTMSETTINQVAMICLMHAADSLVKGGKRGDSGLRMSNVGQTTCHYGMRISQKLPPCQFPITFIMNMMLGDIVEAVFKGLLKEAGVQYEDSKTVHLDVGDDS